MAIAFETAASTSAASRTSLTITKPSSTASGDILVASIYSDSAITSVPTDWTLVVAATQSTLSFRNNVYWKRAGGSEPANYTWQQSSGWMGGAILRFSGCLASGSPIDTYATDQSADGGALTENPVQWAAVTTTVDNTMLVAASVHYDTGLTYGSWSSGLTERVDIDVMGIATGPQASAGSSGAKQATTSSASQWVTVLLALKPAVSSITATASDTSSLTDSGSAGVQLVRVTTSAADSATVTDSAAQVISPVEAVIGDTLVVVDAGTGAVQVVRVTASGYEDLGVTDESIAAVASAFQVIPAVAAEFGEVIRFQSSNW